MIEKDNVGEQPSLDAATSATQVGFDNTSLDSQDGSLGKFKDVESLLKAYNNLQSEFTKKCQSLNELKKQSDNVEKTPQYDKDNWQEQVDEFLKNHPTAKNHTKAIADMLASDKNTALSSISLESAYSKVLEDENKKLTFLLSDEKHIINAITPKMKEKIVSEYLKEVNNSMPFLISSKGGTNVVSSHKRPIDMREAGEMAKQIFK